MLMKTKLFRTQFGNGYPESAKQIEVKINEFLEASPGIKVVDIKLTSSSASPPEGGGQVLHSVTALVMYDE